MKADASKARVADKSVKRRVRLDPDVRRRQIVAQATRLISRSGFNAVSLADIADACEIRKSSILHYFPSMKALLIAVLEGRDAQDFLEARELSLEQPFDFKLINADNAKALTAAKIVANMQRRELIRLFHMLQAEALSPDHPAHEYFKRRTLRTKIELQKILSWMSDPEIAALELISFWHGLEMTWLADPQADIISAWHNFADRFFKK